MERSTVIDEQKLFELWHHRLPGICSQLEQSSSASPSTIYGIERYRSFYQAGTDPAEANDTQSSRRYPPGATFTAMQQKLLLDLSNAWMCLVRHNTQSQNKQAEVLPILQIM